VPILFDTGAVELLRRRNRRAEKLAIDFYPPMLCTAVVGEFLFGQVFANVSSATLLEAKEFLESFEVLTPDTQTAAIYARVRSQLKHKGISLPDPDFWIGAHAIQNNLRLASTDRDFEHFEEIRLHLLPPTG